MNHPRFDNLTKQSWSKTKESLYKGKRITCAYSDDDIVVYQAYNSTIADYAIEHQTFEGCSAYSMSRMSWIKPNFLWMMYRSGWAKKDKNQERILALYINKKDFENIVLKEAVLTSNPFKDEVIDPSRSYYTDEQQWKKEAQTCANSAHRIRVQWDPYHHPSGHKESFTRAIQIGLKGTYLKQFLDRVTSIEDITDFVTEQNQLRLNEEDVEFPVEVEHHLEDDQISRKLCITI
jgi:hypothetical protein